MHLQKPLTGRILSMLCGQAVLIALVELWGRTSPEQLMRVVLIVLLSGLPLAWIAFARPWSIGRSRSRTLFESVSDGVLIIDVDETVMACNSAICRILDVDRRALLGAALWQWISIEGLLNGKARVLRYTRENGQRRYLDIDVGNVGMASERAHRYVFVRDVTERIEQERELRVLQIGIEHVDDIVMIGQVEDSENPSTRVIFVNDAISRMLGYAVDQVIGGRSTMFLGPKSSHAVVHRIQQAVFAREAVRESLIVYKADGEAIWTDWDITPIVSDDTEEGLYVAVVRDISDHKAREDELKRLNAALNDLREAERAKIARDLHDELGQVLSAVKLEAVSIKQLPEMRADVVEQRIDDIALAIDDAIEQVRNLATELRPSMLDDLGFVATARWYISQARKRMGTPIVWEDYLKSEVKLPVDIATVLYRMLQEALTNVARHADASSVHVNFWQDDKRVKLSVEDNGRGCDLDQAGAKGHLGLLGMRERVNSLNGQFMIVSAPGRGCQLYASLPLGEKHVSRRVG